MEVLFHFIFELIKISILSCIYATLIVLTFTIIGNYKPDTWVSRISKEKLQLWFFSGLIISVGLFFFMFSYYGDHGLGDGARIPIGHRRDIQEINGMQAYVEGKGSISTLLIDKFIVADDYVYGFTNDENYNGEFFVYDLINNSIAIFEQEKDYINFLTIKGLNANTGYKEFSYYYEEYWGGWRFLTLP